MDPHSSCGMGMATEPRVELQSVSHGRYQAQSDVHTGRILGTIASRRHWAMCVVVSLADGLEFCDAVRRRTNKGPGRAYWVCDMLCSCSKLVWACGCREPSCVSRRLMHGQTRYGDSILGIVYSFGDAMRFLWLLDSVSSLLLRGFSSGLGRIGQIRMRTTRWLLPTVSVTQ